MKESSILSILVVLLAGCDLAECVRNSDCASGVCNAGDGTCVDPGSTDGNGDTDSTQPPVGGGDCNGYTFEAPLYIIENWECNPIDQPIDFDIPYPLSPLKVIPLYTTGFAAEADELHEVGVCGGGGSPTANWDVVRQGFAESLYQQCLPEVLSVPGCGGQIAEDVCTNQAVKYYMSIGAVPPLTQIPGLLLTDGPCEGGLTFYCDEGVDSSSSG